MLKQFNTALIKAAMAYSASIILVYLLQAFFILVLSFPCTLLFDVLLYFMGLSGTFLFGILFYTLDFHGIYILYIPTTPRGLPDALLSDM